MKIKPRMTTRFKNIFWFILFFTVLFSTIAYLQYWFARKQLLSEATDSLFHTASQIDLLINYHDHWDLTGYDNAYSDALDYYIVTKDGTIVDVEGFVPGLIGRAIWPYSSVFEQPFTIKSECNDTLRVLRRKLPGGIVTVAVVGPKDYTNVDHRLVESARKFGNTIDEACSISSKNIPFEIEYAITDNFGGVRNVWGEVPLRIELTLPIPDAPMIQQDSMGNSDYLLLYWPIKDEGKNNVGLIVTYEDITRSAEVLKSQIRFSTIVAAISFLITIFLLSGYLIFSNRKRSIEKISLDEALKRGEGQNVEFKRAFVDESLVREIAAFSNTNSGNLFIGVDDTSTVVGLQETSQKEKDVLTQKIRNLTLQKIKPAVLPSLDFVIYSDKVVLHIFVPRGGQPLYYVDGVVYIRHIESAVKARPEEVESIIKNFYRFR
ncbi:MAG: helix-turn-helix domain-containing protein [Candidatus Kryptoniota bacterium]